MRGHKNGEEDRTEPNGLSGYRTGGNNRMPHSATMGAVATVKVRTKLKGKTVLGQTQTVKFTNGNVRVRTGRTANTRNRGKMPK